MFKFVAIVDDDPIAILVCETLLKKTKRAERILSFKSAQEGLDFFEKHYSEGGELPDVLFLDVIMPVMDGWDFLDAYSKMASLPEQRPHILMLSAMFDPAEQSKAASNPLVIDFVSKPVNKQLLESLNEM